MTFHSVWPEFTSASFKCLCSVPKVLSRCQPADPAPLSESPSSHPPARPAQPLPREAVTCRVSLSSPLGLGSETQAPALPGGPQLLLWKEDPAWGPPPGRQGGL